MKTWDVTIVRHAYYKRKIQVEAKSAEHARDFAESAIKDGFLSFESKDIQGASEFVASVEGPNRGGDDN